MPELRPRLLLLAIALSSVGCATSYRAGVGASIDTLGQPTLYARVGGSIGLLPGERDGVEERVDLELAVGAPTLVVTPVLGLDYVHLGGEGEASVRAGMRGRFRIRLDGVVEAVSGAALGLFGAFDEHGDERRSLGLELSGNLRNDDDDGRRLDGFFDLTFFYEHRLTTRL